MAYMINEEFDVTFTLKRIYREMPDGSEKVYIAPTESTYSEKKRIPSGLVAYGYFASPYEGDEYTAKAKFRLSEHLGYYLKLTSVPQLKLPATKKELVKYITKNVKGVGKKTTETVVDALGADTIYKIAHSPECLDGLKISEPRKEILRQWAGEKIVLHEILAKTQLLNLPPDVAVRLYDHFGGSVMVKIEQNPYVVTEAGLSFSEADAFAHEYKSLYWDNPERLKAAIISLLWGRSIAGNICYPMEKLMQEVNPYVKRAGVYLITERNKDGKIADYGFTEEQIRGAIEELERDMKIYAARDGKEIFLYLPGNFQNESEVIRGITSRLEKTEKHIGEITFRDTDRLDDVQKSAVKMAASSSFSIITGGPGTGKTYIEKILYRVLKEKNPGIKIELAAPTGRAAGRMTEATGVKAQTLHSLLHILPGGDSMKGYEDFTLSADYLIIDEASMIDAEMMARILSRVDTSTSILLIGDPHQLPSVAPGNVLAELLKIKKIPRITLSKIYRQGKADSVIINNAQAVLSGNVQGLKVGGDFIYMERKNEQSIADTVVALAKKFQREIMTGEFLILSPVHKSMAGTEELNRAIQEAVNPTKTSGVIVGDYELKRGDRVICTKNNAALNLHNGDLGSVVQILASEKEAALEVIFDGEEDSVILEKKDFKDLQLAYCLTVHKAQGSEASKIAMAFSPSHQQMLSSRLIYTGLTRAREKFYCIGDARALAQGVQARESEERYSLLAYSVEEQIKRRFPEN